MEPLFSGLADFLADSQPVEGDVPIEYTAALEELCVVLAATTSQPIPPDELARMVIPGLLALGAIARGVAADSLPAQPLGWTFSLQPAPLKAITLTIRRPGAQPSVLHAQIDRDFRLHGLFTLVVGAAAHEQLLSFDLDKTPDGWYLRRWTDDGRVRFPMQVPVGAPVPWSFGDIAGMWNQFLPASPAPALGAVFGALNPEPGTSRPATLEPAPVNPRSATSESASGTPQPPAHAPAPVIPQATISALSPAPTVHISQPKAAFPDLALVNLDNGQKIPLKARLTIGRGEDNDLRLDDREMSRSHALIVPVPLGWQIQDLNSTNGTWLNDNRLFAPAMLHAGDQLRFGNTRFRVESH
jgi:pSer/pThr/pTyr-binding forkhead associated (FHA) protein